MNDLQHRPTISPRLLAAVFVYGAAASAALLTTFDDAAAESVPRIFNEVGIAPEFGKQISLNLEFVDADGRTVRLSDLFSDRPVILHLVYYECPMLCKLSNDGLLRALSTLSLRLEDDFSIVTVSFNPREGPELSARARNMAIERCGPSAVERGWRFVTGTQEAITKLCQSVGFRYMYDKETRQFAHASGVFILSPDGTLSRYLSGVEYAPRDLQLALVEASMGKVGTMADQALLMCYMYDPAAGKYGVAIMTAVRIAGIATVGGMGLAILTMLRRERKRASGIESVLVSESSGL